MPVPLLIFNAVVGAFPASLLFAVVAPSVVKLTGALPFWVSPTFTESNDTSLAVAKVKFLPSRLTRRFLPAVKVTSSPAAMPSPVVSLVLSVSVISTSSALVALAIHFAELTACATVSTVASLSLSVATGRT